MASHIVGPMLYVSLCQQKYQWLICYRSKPAESNECVCVCEREIHSFSVLKWIVYSEYLRLSKKKYILMKMILIDANLLIIISTKRDFWEQKGICIPKSKPFEIFYAQIDNNNNELLFFNMKSRCLRKIFL